MSKQTRVNILNKALTVSFVILAGTVVTFVFYSHWPLSVIASARVGATTPLSTHLTELPSQPVSSLGLAVADADRLRFLKRLELPPDKLVSASQWLHLMHVLGLGLTQDYHGERLRGIDLFTDTGVSVRYFGEPLFGRTPHGIRYQAAGDGLVAAATREVHRDQVLALFAELGLEADTKLHLAGESYSVRDVINDSVANFHLPHSEMEWSVLAYSRYLSGNGTWTNKFGETYSFNDAANALMNCSLAEHSCAGVHVAMALTMLYRIDVEGGGMLSRSARARVEKWHVDLVKRALAAQTIDGSWDSGWHQGGSRNEEFDLRSRLLVTGHLVEWLLEVPREFNVPPVALRRAGEWLYAQLRELPDETIASRFCPAAHATTALLRLSGSGQQSQNSMTELEASSLDKP